MQPQSNPINEAGNIKRLIINLYTGWGYNAYRKENQDRADDILVRNGICELLGEARAELKNQAEDIRRSIPTPSREAPFPGDVERQRIRAIERADLTIEAVEAIVRSLPVPENDSTWQRHRQETTFLPQLLAHDETMVECALMVRESARQEFDAKSIDTPVQRLKVAIAARKNMLGS